MSDLKGLSNQWQRTLAGDKDMFRSLVEPYLEELRAAAQHEITYRVCVGDLGSGSLSAEDLMAETMIKAWDERRHKPVNLDLEAWLLGLLYRTADLLVGEERQIGELAPVSLDAPAADMASATGWRQPADFETWEEAIPDPKSTPEEIAPAVERQPGALPERGRRILLMHDRHGISLQQAAFATSSSVSGARELLLEARQTLLDGQEASGARRE
ncbi:RNA polymerase sigma factor [Microvirga mediterraneensis]|uniref:RNA polymerase sigma-70 factor, ECF subfamily n=1 Tax=Microvirga mediterraneensis TaxID=2754695 RepID=A0A838BT14_9HYPH|nr:hypothetical protein [Microvirga mediterraneensis]MBA1158964.1 hypothetical protein [Microvirga mediterraneensis]